MTSELLVLDMTNNGTRILIWFLESQDKVAILRMSINRKNVVRPLILYHFTALPKLNLENKSDISLIIMIKCVANLELDNWKTCLTWIHFRSKIIPNQLTIDSSGIFGFSGNIHANFRIENHHLNSAWANPWVASLRKFAGYLEHFDTLFNDLTRVTTMLHGPCTQNAIYQSRIKCTNHRL